MIFDDGFPDDYDHRAVKRIEGRLIKGGPPGCWSFVGAKDSGGYGVIGYRGGVTKTHRVMWTYYNMSPIPPGHEIDHTCENRACVNPTHLEAVTPRVNRARTRGRRAWAL